MWKQCFLWIADPDRRPRKMLRQAAGQLAAVAAAESGIGAVAAEVVCPELPDGCSTSIPTTRDLLFGRATTVLRMGTIVSPGGVGSWRPVAKNVWIRCKSMCSRWEYPTLSSHVCKAPHKPSIATVMVQYSILPGALQN